MGAGISRSSSEAFELFCQGLKGTNDTPIEEIVRIGQHEIDLSDRLIELFAQRGDDPIRFREIRQIIYESPLCEIKSELQEADDDDLLDPITRDLMALDLGWTRELASLAVSSCKGADWSEALSRYRSSSHPKHETQLKVIQSLPWEIHPAIKEGWLNK